MIFILFLSSLCYQIHTAYFCTSTPQRAICLAFQLLGSLIDLRNHGMLEC
uniref:Uncharacterized protein n=1 Tax=Rhizophora mucronata TaxID=61149 RepID=A0A2P2QDK8_RHIMU